MSRIADGLKKNNCEMYQLWRPAEVDGGDGMPRFIVVAADGYRFTNGKSYFLFRNAYEIRNALDAQSLEVIPAAKPVEPTP